MRMAFKEWAVIVDALGTGDQILILRKGGISEGSRGFQIECPEFALFPTLFHQQRESVIESAQHRYDVLAPTLQDTTHLHVQYLAQVVEWHKLESGEDALKLRGQHVWKDEVIAQRYEWGREKAVFALATRVFRLKEAVRLPMLPTYGGCKSWVELEREFSLDDAVPVLDADEFARRLGQFRQALTK